MKKNLNLVTFIAVLVFSACTKNVQQLKEETNFESAAAKAPGGSSGSGALYLTVTVADGNEIQSDGGGAYTHGVGNVDARILSDGTFYLQTNTNDRRDGRKLRFPNSATYDRAGITVNGKKNYTMRTNDVNLYSIALGATQENVRFTVRGIDAGKVDWLLQYQNGIEAGGAATDFVRVTRSADGNSWTIEPMGTARSGLYDADAYGNAISTSGSHHENVTFSVSLTKK